MALTTRRAAGEGAPDLALHVLDAAGWTRTGDELGNTTFTSPDGTVKAAFGPETDAHYAHGPLWTVVSTPHETGGEARGECNPPCGWTATFGDQTPAEHVAAFFRDLADTTPLDTDRADDYRNRRTQLT